MNLNQLLVPTALLAALAAPGCNTSTEGANGNIVFTPMNCGRLGCDFDDSIGVGGRLEVTIEGTEGVSTAGVTLDVDDPAVLSVTSIPDVGGRPAWELQGEGAGVAEILAIDADGFELDFLQVGVQELSGLAMTNVLGDAVGPDTDLDFDEVWTVNADEAVSFQVTPLIGDGVPTMGVYTYTATIDAGMEVGLLDDDLSQGYLYFNVPEGDYVVSFEDDYGNFLDVLIVAQAAAE